MRARCRLLHSRRHMLIGVVLVWLTACASQTVHTQTTALPPTLAAGAYALAFAPTLGAVTPTTTLYAFDAATGTPRWQVQPAGQVDAAPAANRALVYVGTNSVTNEAGANAPGMVSAYDAATGAIQWHSTLPHVSQVVAFATGVLVGTESVAATSQPPSQSQYSITALSATNGVHLWTFPTRLTEVGIAPVVANGIVYIATNPRPSSTTPFPPTIVSALNSTTGAVLWQRRVHALVTGMAADGDGVCLSGAVAPVQPHVTPTGLLTALRGYGGTLLWQTPLPTPPSAPVLDAASVYSGTTVDATTTITAFARATGKPRWSTTTGTIATGADEASFALLGATLFASTVAPAPSSVVALRTTDGSLRWQRPEDEALTPPTVFGNAVYVGMGTALQTAQSGRIESLDAQTGLVAWRFQTPGSFQFPPTVG